MNRGEPAEVHGFREGLRAEYDRRFPRSREFLDRASEHLLDGTSHAVRWNDPFMPVAAEASGSTVVDLDGHRMVDYWQGHLTNLLGHNPPLIRQALIDALQQGRGLQTGMLHEAEGRVAELICRHTGMETVRLTTSGTLGTFYAVVLSRAFTGRDKVLKISGGWHGSQPFGLKGVFRKDESFDHMESEGLSASTGAEIVLTRFNDVDDLAEKFEKLGDSIACLIVEPMLSSAGGMPATRDYLRTARELTERHGALLLSDEIITGYRFRLGDLSSAYGVRPDLLILGKVVGGGMPVSAVAGRRDVLGLCSRRQHRVKFEGGTYSAHQLSMIAASTLLRHLEVAHERIYEGLAEQGRKLREGVSAAAREVNLPLHVLGDLGRGLPGSSLIHAHVGREGSTAPRCPEDLVGQGHRWIDESLLKAVLLLEDVSTRSGGGAVSTAHTPDDLSRTVEACRAAFARFKAAGLV